jgi:hypothetical protein
MHALCAISFPTYQQRPRNEDHDSTRLAGRLGIYCRNLVLHTLEREILYLLGDSILMDIFVIYVTYNELFDDAS